MQLIQLDSQRRCDFVFRGGPPESVLDLFICLLELPPLLAHGARNPVQRSQLVQYGSVRSGDDSESALPGDIFEDPSSQNPFDWVEARQDGEALSQCIAQLPEREKLVITLYYYEDLSMKEIGGILGITESRVCQIHAKSLAHLRLRLSGRSLAIRASGLQFPRSPEAH